MTHKSFDAIAPSCGCHGPACIDELAVALAEFEQYLEQLSSAIALPNTIRADQLTCGDIIKHGTGDVWQVIGELEYTAFGIEFDVLWLDVDSPDNIQGVCFAPGQEFELVSHQPAQPSKHESKQVDRPSFIHAHIHQGQLIGILEDKAGFTFRVFSPGEVFEEARRHYPKMEMALDAAIKQVESDWRWECGFAAYERGEPLPEIADLDFIRGWHDGQQAHGRAA